MGVLMLGQKGHEARPDPGSSKEPFEALLSWFL